MPFNQQVVTPENIVRSTMETFLGRCLSEHPHLSECTVEVKDAAIFVHWPETKESLSQNYPPGLFDPVAEVMMQSLSINLPARLVLLDVELPALRILLTTNLGLPHLERLLIRVFAEALYNDTGDRGRAGGFPLLVNVEIEEIEMETEVDEFFRVLWVGATKLHEWVAHLGAPNAVITYKCLGQQTQTLDGMIQEYAKILADQKKRAAEERVAEERAAEETAAEERATEESETE